MEEDQQNQNKNEKPRYYATDFNEIKENLSDEEKLLFERYKQMLSGIIPADSASSAPANDAPSSSSSPSNNPPSLKPLLNHLKDISQKTMKQMARGKLPGFHHFVANHRIAASTPCPDTRNSR